MRRLIAPSLSVGAAACALVLAACSDTSTSPRRLSPDAAAFTLGPSANVGPVQLSFASGATTQYCAVSGYPAIHTYTVPGSLGPLTGCGAAFDLMTNLTTSYNPGWSAPITGSDWIGPNATSNEYRTAPGSYVFQTTFSGPSGVTSPVLNDTLMSDNAVAVYLNGHQLATQVIQDCPSADRLAGTCNWQTKYVVSDANAADFNIGGVNTITVLLVDTPNGGNAGNSYACTTTFQPNGELGFGTAFNVPTSPNHVVANWTTTMTATTGCENPTGLDFHGNVSWVVPVVTTWCSPGYWKNHLGSWPVSLQNTGYNTYSAQYVRDPKMIAGNPTLVQVISNPSIYKGPATNNVADVISNFLFGTGFGNGVESCPLN